MIASFVLVLFFDAGDNGQQIPPSQTYKYLSTLQHTFAANNGSAPINPIFLIKYPSFYEGQDAMQTFNFQRCRAQMLFRTLHGVIIGHPPGRSQNPINLTPRTLLRMDIIIVRATWNIRVLCNAASCTSLS